MRDQQKVLPTSTPPGRLQINGLKPGKYLLKVDGKELLEASHSDWRRGIPIDQGPQFEQAEELRQAILKKNELYFNRWRPQNETYLFGFRKHEQGQNAKEIPMFDPLISEQEAKIATLRKPRKHVFEVLPVKAQNAGLGTEKPAFRRGPSKLRQAGIRKRPGCSKSPMGSK